ncbi:MAG: Sec-independent protein translocase subunit TatB [Serratia symbiotica]|nr:Sec-independent protein translocase subunit TatB [Serratia symbiotica]
MFDIGFSELLLVLVIGLVVLGPERLPVAVRTVSSWVRALRSLAALVQNELAQELKLQELQDSLKKAEQAGLQHLTPELKASMEEATESLKRTYQGERATPLHNPQVTDPAASHAGVTPTLVEPQPATRSVATPSITTASEPVAEKTSSSHQPSGDR